MPLVRRPALLVIYAAFLLTVSGFYFIHYPIPGLGTRLAQVGLAGGTVALAACVGRWVLRRRFFAGLGLDRAGAEGFLWAVALGLPPLSLGLLGVGILGHFNREAFLFFAAALLLVARRDAAHWFVCARGLKTWPRPTGLGFLSVGILGLGLLCAFAPPTYYDSLVYHLALPSTYLQSGRVGFVPYNQYAHFPQNMEMLFGWFLALGSDVSAQVFNVMLAALTGGGVGLFFRRAGSAFRWDLLLFLTAPCLLLLSTETYVETSTAFFTLLAVVAAARGLADGRRAWFVLSGLLGGFTAGIKYTGVLTPIILTALVLLWPRARAWRARVGDGAAVAGVSFLVFLPWMIKNAVFTGGNPVFPFLPSLFPAKNVYLPEASAGAYFQVLDEYRGTSSLLIELFKMPFRLATQATSFGGGFDVTGDLGWALPLLLLPLALLTVRTGGPFPFLLAYTAVHLLLWASLRPVLRFLFPLFPLVCALAGAGVSEALRGAGRGLRGAAAAGAALFALSGLVQGYWVERVRDPFPVAFGLVSREDYLSTKLDYYPWMALMEKELPAHSRVLFVGDQRAYYCPRPHVAPMALLPQPLKDWAGDAADGEALRRRLVGMGFTHLFVNRREGERLKQYYSLTGRAAENFDALVKSLPAIANLPAAGLFALERT